MDTVLVFGRKRPNNDSIMSSLVTAQLGNALSPDFNHVPVRLGELPIETAKLFQAWDIEPLEYLDRIPAPLPGEPKQKVFLCDHNEPVQSVEGIEYADVIGVLDHHRLATVHTYRPTIFVSMPWGATATIVAHQIRGLGYVPSALQAACLLSAILTDTLMLKSPTTTAADTNYALRMAERLGVDAFEFGVKVFSYRNSEAYTPQQMVQGDMKCYEIAGKRVAFAKYETMDRTPALDCIPALHDEMEAAREAHDIDTLVFCATDILAGGSHILVSGNTSAVESGLHIDIPTEGTWLEGVLSRKAQIVSPVLAAFEKLV